jgi:hypothetical protein
MSAACIICYDMNIDLLKEKLQLGKLKPYSSLKPPQLNFQLWSILATRVMRPCDSPRARTGVPPQTLPRLCAIISKNKTAHHRHSAR